MRGSSPLAGLAFGGAAALAAIPWSMLAGPAFGRPWAVAVYCLAAAVLYVVTIAPSWPRGVAIGGLAGLLAIAVGLLAPWPSEAIVGAALILAVARSGFLYRSSPARALLLEGALAFGGLLFARAMGGPGPLGIALGIWSFFLVQSLFFLAGGVEERAPATPGVDPFERARSRALALMDDG